MPFTVKTVAKPREVAKVKDVLLKEPKDINKKKLCFAVGAGGIPPSGGDKDPFKKSLTPEMISKMMEIVGNNNKIWLDKSFDKNLYNKTKLFS